MHIVRYGLLCFIMCSLLKAQGAVLSVGEAVIDWIYQVDDDFLDMQQIPKGGSTKVELDTFMRLQGLLDKSEPPSVVPGGSAANTLKGLAKLSHHCKYVGKVGNDPLGTKFQESLQVYRIEPHLFFSPKHTTQVLSMVTPDGQRTMRCCFGASDDLSKEALSPALFQDVSHLHIEGYTFYKEKMLLDLIKLAKEAKATISIDLASRELVANFKDKILPVLKDSIDIVIANEDEAKALTGLAPKEACYEMQKICPIAVVLVGENGCIVGSQGTVFESFGLEVPVIDTTGAGDLFASGFLHGYLTRQPLETCAYFGNLVGSTCVTEVGAQINDAKWDALCGLIK